MSFRHVSSCKLHGLGFKCDTLVLKLGLVSSCGFGGEDITEYKAHQSSSLPFSFSVVVHSMSIPLA